MLSQPLVGAQMEALGGSESSTLRVQAPDVRDMADIHPKGGLPYLELPSAPVAPGSR